MAVAGPFTRVAQLRLGALKFSFVMGIPWFIIILKRTVESWIREDNSADTELKLEEGREPPEKF